MELSGTALADAGTLQTKAGIGANIMLGFFESAYKAERKRCFAAYIYAHAQAYAIGYDATLQGNMFRNNTYTVSSSSITRFTGENKLGFVLRYGGIYLEYYQAQLTREFTTGNPHAWGGVLLGVGF